MHTTNAYAYNSVTQEHNNNNNRNRMCFFRSAVSDKHRPSAQPQIEYLRPLPIIIQLQVSK